MRLYVDIDKATAAAQKLIELLRLISHVSPAPSIARSKNIVARMLGYRNWQDLELNSQNSHSLPDHMILSSERYHRRQIQAKALEKEGVSSIDAFAIAEILIVSGDFKSEVPKIMSYIDSWIRKLGRLASEEELNTEWLIHSLGLPEDKRRWANNVALKRIDLDGGVAKAIRNETAAFKPSPNADGYFVVIAKPRLFYQGYFLSNPGEDVLEKIDSTVREALNLKKGDKLAELTSIFEGMMQGRPPSKTNTYIGALQAAIIESSMMQPQNPIQMAGLATLLSRATEEKFFIVSLDSDPDSGMVTSMRPLDVTSTEDARQTIKRLPEVIEIEKALAATLSFRRPSNNGS